MCAENRLETCVFCRTFSFRKSFSKSQSNFLATLNQKYFSNNYDVFLMFINQLNIATDVIVLTETRYFEENLITFRATDLLTLFAQKN